LDKQAEGRGSPLGFVWLLAANTSQNPLKIPAGIPFGILLVLTANSRHKTALHPSARNFFGIFGAEDAALLTQGKDDKAKIIERTAEGLVVFRSPLLRRYYH